MSEGDTIPMRGSADMWRSRAKAAEAEVERLTDCLETQYEINRNTARAACEARGDHFDAEDRIAELEAELLGAMREKEDVRRTATEAALRWVENNLGHFNFWYTRADTVTKREEWIARGLAALLGEGEAK